MPTVQNLQVVKKGMVIMEQYIEDILKKIDHMSTSFYQQKNNEGYQELVSVLDDLNVMLNFLEDNKSLPEIQTYYSELTISLNASMEAVEKKDTILIADIFHYDIKEVIEHVSELIS